MFLGDDPGDVQKDKELYKQEEPVIFYWYTPQFLNQAGGDPEQYTCEYDITIINKLFSQEFAESSRSPRRSPVQGGSRPGREGRPVVDRYRASLP